MTELFLQNTRTRSKERFTPIDPQNVRVYVCGPTVYERAHLGNARSAVAFDVMHRLLCQLYPQVTYVRNITDVDDKINAAALAQNRPISEITIETTRWFQEDMHALQVLSPTHEPRATDYIPHMIKMIEILIAKGHAYEAQGHVLFRVSSFAEYGKFSGSSPDAILAGARVEVAPYKQDPTDFVLWKPSDADLPGWDSPWGRGRPGWHIECSAMSLDLLGFPFDIHTGGQDLIFPHHENEIAQGTCAQNAYDGTCAQNHLVANYWLHNGFLKVEGEKMSKSRGNFLFVHDLLQKYPGEVIRLALISTHYRQALDWTQTSPQQAQQTLDRFYTALQAALDAGLSSRVLESTNPRGASPELLEALCDDMNTPKALAILHEQASTVLRAATKGGPKGRADARYAAEQLLYGGRLLGVLQHMPEAWFQKLTSGDNLDTELSPDAIEALLQERRDARSAGDYAHADAIRDQLMGLGISIEDGQGQTRWKRIRAQE